MYQYNNLLYGVNFSDHYSNIRFRAKIDNGIIHSEKKERIREWRNNNLV